MPNSRALPTATLLFCASVPAFSATWHEINSPHFRVVTDGSAKDGRIVANEFEQMRHVFVVRFKNEDVETGAPLTIVALRDETNLKSLGPGFWKDRERVAGLFHKGWERQFALVRLDSFGDLNQAVVFHEYTHSVLHANLHWLPTWLDEGLAEFYAYTRFQSDRIYVGAPSIRLAHLRAETPIPIAELLQANGDTYAKDPRREDEFYGESWATVHYMMFGKDMNNGEKLQHFLQLTEAGTDQKNAFQQVFGDYTAFDEGFRLYLTRFAMNAMVLPPNKGLDSKTFTERDLTPAEADTVLGSFAAGARESATARVLLEKAVATQPELAEAREELGFLDFREGRDAEAHEQWKQSVALDPKRYRSQFALIMTGTPIAQLSPGQIRATQIALQRVTEVAPRFAPAFAELALLDWRMHMMPQAYHDATQAARLEPWRAGYRLLVGHILLRGSQPAEAAKYARIVAERWLGSDHDEAVDLWSELPATARGDGPALKLDTPAGVRLLRGTIVSTACIGEGKDSRFHIAIQPDGPGESPVSLDTPFRFESGFSDTLWWGEDHYTPCHHLEGLRTLTLYKPEDNTLIKFEIRDLLPDEPAPATVVATSAHP